MSAPQTIGELKFSDVPVIDEGMITAIFGVAGSGKSCVGAILLEGCRVREGRKVFYYPESFAFHDGEPLKLSDLVAGHEKLRGAAVLVDEFQRLLSKYLAASLSSQNVAGLLEQVRKLGIRLIVTSNNENMINLEALMPHVKLRLDCTKLTDDRCEGLPYHLADCTDTAIVLITDERMRHGRSNKHWDGKKRNVWRIRHLIRYYKLYNTFASVDAMEIRAMDADNVRLAHEDAQTGMGYDDFLRMLSVEIVPELVSDGATELVIFPFKQWLAKRGIDAPTERIQRGLKEIGLLPVRGSAGNRFKLPTQEDLNEWMSGIMQEG